MAEAVVMITRPGEPARPVQAWSLLIEADVHGPSQATFITDGRHEKFTEAAVLVDGLVVADGWVELCEGLGDGTGLYAVTVWCWQRHTDDDLFARTFQLAGFADAIDARDGPYVNQAYWARSGPRLAERSLTLGVQPNTIWYAQQAGGVTIDLGPSSAPGGGGQSARRVWLHQTANNFPAKASMDLILHAHSTRGDHYPPGAYVTTGPQNNIAGQSGAMWRSFTLPANSFRYLTIFLRSTVTYDMAKSSAEYFIAFDDLRIDLTGGVGNGDVVFVQSVVPAIVAVSPKLTLGDNPASDTFMLRLKTEGFQSTRQMLERVNLDQWRWRVNPGRVLHLGPYPTVPAATVGREALSRLRTPESYSALVISYTDPVGDRREYIRTVPSVQQRTQAIALDGNAVDAQAARVADAYFLDQAQRRIEGSCSVAPGQLSERPSGQPLHPARLLLMGGDRAWIDEAGEHARIATVSYSHESETAEVALSEPQDDLDRELAHLANQPT